MSMSMKVVKRNGDQEEVSFDKVLTRIQLAAKDLEVNPTLIAQRTLLRIYDGVKTTELDELAAQLSVSLMTTNPQGWQWTAQRHAALWLKRRIR